MLSKTALLKYNLEKYPFSTFDKEQFYPHQRTLSSFSNPRYTEIISTTTCTESE